MDRFGILVVSKSIKKTSSIILLATTMLSTNYNYTVTFCLLIYYCGLSIGQIANPMKLNQ
jgi:hypothetical protein